MSSTLTDKGPETQQDQRAIRKRMGDVMDVVRIENATARQSFTWWSKTAGISLVMDWDALAKDGIDPQKTINLDLKSVPVGQVLALLMRQVSTENQPLLYELTPWYVQITTKAQADRNPVLRVYQVRDLVHAIPTFASPPEFDLSTALSQSGTRGGRSGASGSTSSQGLFTQQTMVVSDHKTQTQRGEELAKLVMDTIEPGIWKEQGSGNCSVKYFDGRLIVNAPLYVHAQIGLPEPGIGRSLPDRLPGPVMVRSQDAGHGGQSKVSSVQPDVGLKVSGKRAP